MLGLTKELPFPEHGGAWGPWFSTFWGSGEAPGHSLLALREHLGSVVLNLLVASLEPPVGQGGEPGVG